MAEESATGAVVLGLVAAGVAIFAIDHVYSDPGKSWFDQIKNRLASKGEGPRALPPAKGSADGRRAKRLPGRQVSEARQAGPSQPSQLSPIARRPAVLPPQIVTPDVVRQLAMRLNQVLHTNLRVNGIITTEMNQALRRAQAQLGLPQTGYPDAQTLQKLGLGTGVGGAKTSQTRTAPITSSSKTSPVTEVTKVISKTFGGPPGALATGPDEGMRKAQHMLNLYFGGSLLAENGIAGPETVEKIGAFQDALGLPRTGTVNQKTYDILESAVRQSGAPAAQVSAQMTSRLKEAIMRLNGLLHTSIPVTGTTSPELSQAIVRFQELASLPQTGMLDPATLDKLREKTSHGVQEDVSGYFVGVDAGDWKSETQGLPQFSQDVLSKIIATETNQRTLKSVGKVLGDAGYPKAAAAVLAKAGGAAATTGYFPDPHYGVYPFAHGPWWAYPQASWGW